MQAPKYTGYPEVPTMEQSEQLDSDCTSCEVGNHSNRDLLYSTDQVFTPESHLLLSILLDHLTFSCIKVAPTAATDTVWWKLRGGPCGMQTPSYVL